MIVDLSEHHARLLNMLPTIANNVAAGNVNGLIVISFLHTGQVLRSQNLTRVDIHQVIGILDAIKLEMLLHARPD